MPGREGAIEDLVKGFDSFGLTPTDLAGKLDWLNVSCASSQSVNAMSLRE